MTNEASIPPADEDFASDEQPTRPLSSVDMLLALTDEGWDVDADVQTLQRAATEEATSRGRLSIVPQGRVPTRIPTLILPLAAEMAPPPPSSSTDVTKPRPSARPPALTLSKPPPVPPKGARSVPPPPMTADAENARIRTASGPVDHDELASLLKARAVALENTKDKVGLARTYMELAVLSETLGTDDSPATRYAELALKVAPGMPAAHSLLRRRKHGKTALAAMVGHIDQEIAGSGNEEAGVELLVERARLQSARAADATAAKEAWEGALRQAPQHASALKGYESELAFQVAGDEKTAWAALATHLATMARAYADEPTLAAWLFVERARIADSKLGQMEVARNALERALELDPGVGPVRDAALAHVSLTRDAAAQAMLLEQEASIESSPIRQVQLEFEAACIVEARLSEPARVIRLLERAARRAPTAPRLDRRVLDELIRHYESANRWDDAATARRARLSFISDPVALAYELRALATIEERRGDLDAAVNDLTRALHYDASDGHLLEHTDRLLEQMDQTERRVSLWTNEATRNADATARALALLRAAKLCERQLGQRDEAVRHLRGAWLSAPGHTEVFEGLARLLVPEPSGDAASKARALLELYAQAVLHTMDIGRKVALLEKSALLWEDFLGDFERACSVYEEVLKLRPSHQAAILGLQRTAARSGNDATLLRALRMEAELVTAPGGRISLETRAAEVLSRTDASRALSDLEDVLARDPSFSPARALSIRLHEEAGRWEQVTDQLEAKVENEQDAREKVNALLMLAHVQEVRLARPLDALASLRQARQVDGRHPVVAEEVARVVRSLGDPEKLRDAYEELASTSVSPEEKWLYLTRSGEIDELWLDDDVRATGTYNRLLAENPDDDLLADRVARLLTRRARSEREGAGRDRNSPRAELVRLYTARAAEAHADRKARLQFAAATTLLFLQEDFRKAASMLESVVAFDGRHAGALRTLEWVARRTGDFALLSKCLSQQASAWARVKPKLGALWNLAWVQEWRLPVAQQSQVYDAILDVDPRDPGALSAIVRRQLTPARQGEEEARRTLVRALRALIPYAPDQDQTHLLQARLSLLLEIEGAGIGDTKLAQEALERYRAALFIDPISVTAATGLARLANRLADYEGAVAAALALSDLTAHPAMRARYLLDASDLLLSETRDERMGSFEERRKKAAALLDRALDADPNALQAAERLSTLRLEGGEGERLVESFRSALRRAHDTDAVVFMGMQVAHVLRDEVHDLAGAIEAMRGVLKAAPESAQALLLMSELCVAQRAWPEAVGALEAAAKCAQEGGTKNTALFALASIYGKVLNQPENAERVLLKALDVDPNSARALRAIVHQCGERVRKEPSHDSTRKLAGFLERLAHVEEDPVKKAELFAELATVYLSLPDPEGAERAIIDSVALTSDAKAFDKMREFYAKFHPSDDAAYARGLSFLIARGQQIGNLDARWFVALAGVEVDAMGRIHDGIQHLHKALSLEPDYHDAKVRLAYAYARTNGYEQAARTLTELLRDERGVLFELREPKMVLDLLEQTLSAQHRREEATVASELRALAGRLEPARASSLSARRLPPGTPAPDSLSRPTLVTHVAPVEARHILLEVAAAVSGVEARVLRSNLADLDLSARDRIGARSGHPVRTLLDRLATAFGVTDYELVVTDAVSAPRILSQDVPWLVLPKGLADRAENVQTAALARLLARMTLGVSWLQELPADHVHAYLIASARQAVPTYAQEQVDNATENLIEYYMPLIGRGLARRHRKLLEDLAPHVKGPSGRLRSVTDFIGGLLRAEVRAGYLLSGDLLATTAEVSLTHPELAVALKSANLQTLRAVLSDFILGDTCRFALGSEAFALRRRIGSVWAQA